MGIRHLRGAGRMKLNKYMAERKHRKTSEHTDSRKHEEHPSHESPNTKGYVKGRMCPFVTSHLGQLRHLECIAHHCVLWDGKHTTCSLRTIPLLLSEIKK